MSCNLFTFCLYITICISSILCSENISSIEHITLQNFESKISSQPSTLVEFYIDQCNACEMLASDYQQAHDQLHANNIDIYKVHCHDQKELCRNLKIHAYPTIKSYKNGKYRSDVIERTAKDLVNIVMKLSKPSCSKLSSDKVQEFVRDSNLSYIAYLLPDSENAVQFENATEIFQEIADFGLISSEKDQRIEVYHNGVLDSRATLNVTTLDPEQLQIFILVERLPLIGSLDENTYGDYWMTGLPIVHLFYTTDAEKEDLVQLSTDLAKEFRYNATIGVINASIHASHAQSIGLNDQKFPACSIFHPTKLHKFPMAQDKDITKEGLKQHIQDVITENVLPFIISAEPPSPNNDPVMIIVRKQFNDLVLDPKKDALVMFYTSDCAACKRFSHYFDMIGMAFSNHKNTTIIGKMNLNTNDPPEVDLVIEYVPTLCLFPASSDDKTLTKSFVIYEGDFSLDSIFDFLKQHSVHKVEPQDYNEGDIEDEYDEEHLEL